MWVRFPNDFQGIVSRLVHFTQSSMMTALLCDSKSSPQSSHIIKHNLSNPKPGHAAGWRAGGPAGLRFGRAAGRWVAGAGRRAGASGLGGGRRGGLAVDQSLRSPSRLSE
jgi:hypothetical protein